MNVRAYGGEGIEKCILNFDTRRKRAVSVTSGPLCPLRKSPWYHMNTGWVRPTVGRDVLEKGTSCNAARIETLRLSKEESLVPYEHRLGVPNCWEECFGEGNMF
jgi:hypothetical protein